MLLRKYAKAALLSVGITPSDAASTLKLTWAAQLYAGWQARQSIMSAAHRSAFVIRTVTGFNPRLETKKQPGCIRIASLWEPNGRMRWLDHENDDPLCEVIHLPRSLFAAAWQYYLRDYRESLVTERRLGEYALDWYFREEFQDDRERFVEYCMAVANILNSTFDIDVFMLPKVNDDWTIDNIEALRRLDVRLLIDDRESATTPARLRAVAPILRELLDIKFDLLCVHNAAHRELFVQGGLDADRIIVNGAPQTDHWHRPDLWPSRSQIHPGLRDDRILLLFLSFGPRSYMNFYYGDEPRDWMPLCRDYHRALLWLLRDYGDRIQIVYKTGSKPMRDMFPDHAEFLKAAAPYITEENFIELNSTYDAYDLMSNTDIFLGFQTSGLIEAMFTDKPIIYGAWGDLYDDIKETLLPLHSTPALTYANSLDGLWEALEEAVQDAGKTPIDSSVAETRRQFRERYFHRPDGKVSARLLDYAKEIARSEGHWLPDSRETGDIAFSRTLAKPGETPPLSLDT